MSKQAEFETVDLTPSPAGTARIYARLVQAAAFQPNKVKRDKILNALVEDLLRLANALEGIETYDVLETMIANHRANVAIEEMVES